MQNSYNKKQRDKGTSKCRSRNCRSKSAFLRVSQSWKFDEVINFWYKPLKNQITAITNTRSSISKIQSLQKGSINYLSSHPWCLKFASALSHPTQWRSYSQRMGKSVAHSVINFVTTVEIYMTEIRSIWCTEKIHHVRRRTSNYKYTCFIFRIVSRNLLNGAPFAP